ncbi:hypothetical protein BHE74_00053867, partial [Ensete ventricosum]
CLHLVGHLDLFVCRATRTLKRSRHVHRSEHRAERHCRRRYLCVPPPATALAPPPSRVMPPGKPRSKRGSSADPAAAAAATARLADGFGRALQRGRGADRVREAGDALGSRSTYPTDSHDAQAVIGSSSD